MYLGDHTAHGDGPGGAPGEAVRVHYVAVDEAGKNNRGIGIDDDYLSKQAPGICYGRATVLLVHHVRQVVVVLQGQLRVEVSCNNAICNALLQLYWVLYFFAVYIVQFGVVLCSYFAIPPPSSPLSPSVSCRCSLLTPPGRKRWDCSSLEISFMGMVVARLSGH